MVIFQNGKKFQEHKYNTEEELERVVTNNSKLFFGKDTIYIDIKKRVETKALGRAIPDGFLFDLADRENPEFYVVETELAAHDFFGHIFPQVTKFFAFFNDNQSETKLVEIIFSTINNDSALKKEFKKYLGEQEVYKFIKDTVDDSQNILLIIDDDKMELPDIMRVYTDTWGRMVTLLILKKFVNGNDVIFTLNPSFENIELGGTIQIQEVDEAEEIEYNEEFHLVRVVTEIKETYYKIKEVILLFNPNLRFNPKKYYISIVHEKNVAFFLFRKKKIRLVVMLPEEDVRIKMKKHKVEHLSESVQRFWNGPSCEIVIENKKDIDEVIELLKILIK